MSSVRPKKTIADLIDNREFKQGEIYSIRDKLISIPDADITERDIHFTRPVVILHETPLNSSPTFPTVSIVPLSHDISYKKSCDLQLEPEEGSVIKPCLARFGLIQPVLKIDLVGPKGQLSDQQIKDLLTMQAFLHGMI